MSRMERKQMYGKECLVQLHVTGIYVCHIKAFEASHKELFFFTMHKKSLQSKGGRVVSMDQGKENV